MKTHLKKTKSELISEIIKLEKENRMYKKKHTENILYPLKNISDEEYSLISGMETDAIFKGDTHGNFLLVNDFATKLTGYTEEELLRMKMDDLFTDDVLGKKSLRYDLLNQGETVRGRKEILRKDGQLVPIELISKKLSDGTLICFMNDQTEEQLLNKALSESENRYKLVVDAAEEGIWDWYVNTDIVYYSDKWKAQVGYLPNEFPDRFSSWENILHPEDRERMYNEVQNYLRCPIKHFTAEFRLKHKDGTYRWIRNKASSVLNEKGEVIRMFGAHTDITEEIKAKTELIESEKKYRLLFELLPYGGEIIDKNGYIIEVSPGTAKLLGYSVDEMIGTHFSKFVSPRELVIFRKKFTQLLKGNKEIGEMNMIKKDGTKVTVIRAGQPIIYSHGKIDAILSLSVDITDRKKIESELFEKNKTIEAKNEEYIKINNELKIAGEHAEENENRLMTFINSIPDIICYKDGDGRWLLANQADLELFQLKDVDYIGKTNLDLAEYTHEIYRESFNNCARTDSVTWEKGAINKEVEVISTVTGDKKIFDVYKIPIFYPDGRRKSLAVIGRDITELLNIQEKLIKAKEKAEESNVLKSAFLANISHEIRTPMNGILGFSQLLSTPGLTDSKIKEYTDIISMSGRHLLTIIDDIIEIAKIDAGQIRILKKITNVNRVLQDLYKFYGSPDNVKLNKNVAFVIKTTLNDDDVNILTDEIRFRQIFTNLINNAMKFTEKGFIEFGYFKEIDNLIFYVKDTGIGIHPSKHTLVFERFTQASAKTGKIYGGTGLGLAISKAYSKLLGGEIFLESEPGKGSTFFFSIPFDKTNPEPARKPEIFEKEFTGNNQIILIVEDDDVNIEYIKELLADMALKMHFVKTSKDAINFVKTGKADLILMDIKLPDNDGNFTVKEIRKFNPGIPIIVQSAFAFENEKMKSFEAGCNEYIVKPIRKIELINKMKKYLN